MKLKGSLLAIFYSVSLILQGQSDFNANFKLKESNGQKALENALVEIFIGPLINIPVFFLVEKSVEEDINVNTFLSTCQLASKYFYCIDELQIQNHIPLDNGSSKISCTFPDLERSSLVTVVFVTQHSDFTIHLVNKLNAKFLAIVLLKDEYSIMKELPNKLTNNFQRVIILRKFIDILEHKIFVHIYTLLPFEDPINGRYMFMGTWNNSNFKNFQDIFVDRFKTFQAETLHIASDHDDYPLVTYVDNNTEAGISIEMVRALSTWLNFTYTTTSKAADSGWGKLDNGSWSGLLGEVIHGEKNFTINYFAVTEERNNYFKSSISYRFEGFGFALKRPSPLPPWKKLIYPFTWKVWLCSLVSFVAASLLIGLVEKVANQIERSVSFSGSFTEIVLGVIMNTRNPPARWSVRVMNASWWWTALFLNFFYTTNLIAVLTVPAFPRTLSTVEDLAKSDIKIMMLDYGEFVPEALATSADHNLHALGEKLKLFPMGDATASFVLYNELLQALNKGEYAMLETYSYLKILLKKSWLPANRYYFLKEEIYTGGLAFFFPKHCPWVYKFDEGMQHLVEAGLVNKWYNDLMGEKDQNDVNDDSASTLSMYHLQGPFFVLLLGVGLASVVFMAEIFVHQ